MCSLLSRVFLTGVNGGGVTYMAHRHELRFCEQEIMMAQYPFLAPRPLVRSGRGGEAQTNLKPICLLSR
jgi:hypothetical protein